jgi:mono/diheme cytochrome c family protein
MAMTDMSFRSRLMAIGVIAGAWLQPLPGSAQTAVDEEHAARKADAEQYFRDHVAPFVKTHCLACHSSKRPTEGT